MENTSGPVSKTLHIPTSWYNLKTYDTSVQVVESVYSFLLNQGNTSLGKRHESIAAISERTLKNMESDFGYSPEMTRENLKFVVGHEKIRLL